MVEFNRDEQAGDKHFDNMAFENKENGCYVGSEDQQRREKFKDESQSFAKFRGTGGEE